MSDSYGIMRSAQINCLRNCADLIERLTLPFSTALLTQLSNTLCLRSWHNKRQAFIISLFQSPRRYADQRSASCISDDHTMPLRSWYNKRKRLLYPYFKVLADTQIKDLLPAYRTIIPCPCGHGMINASVYYILISFNNLQIMINYAILESTRGAGYVNGKD